MTAALPREVMVTGLPVRHLRLITDLLTPHTTVTTALPCRYATGAVHITDRSPSRLSQADLPTIVVGPDPRAAMNSGADDALTPDELPGHLIGALRGLRHLWGEAPYHVQSFGHPFIRRRPGLTLRLTRGQNMLLHHLLTFRHATHAERIADLWPGQPPMRQGRSLLYTNVHRLKEILGADVIQLTNQGGTYRVKNVVSDVDVFRTPPGEHTFTQLTALTERYRPYLQGLDAPWITAQREAFAALHEQRLNVIERHTCRSDSEARAAGRALSAGRQFL